MILKVESFEYKSTDRLFNVGGSDIHHDIEELVSSSLEIRNFIIFWSNLFL